MKKLFILEETALKYPYQLPELGYSYLALEPFIDAMTMEIHHTKHHGTYVSNVNQILENDARKEIPLTEIFLKIEEFPVGVRNNGGGHINHYLFWKWLKLNENEKPSGDLFKHIEKTFGSFTQFQEEFTKAALNRFGSGWAWLILTEDNQLKVISTPNQDNPLMSIAEVKGYPILGLDVWEHAYYLKYQNRRADYVKAFWNVINWEAVQERYEKIIGS
ncbi:MAG: superoxide dismutase [Bacteroidales bacterium]|nr:superoxide dismutase [Bacteroidales bacterium]